MAAFKFSCGVSLSLFFIVLGGGLSIGQLFEIDGRSINYSIYFLSFLCVTVLFGLRKKPTYCFSIANKWFYFYFVTYFFYVFFRADFSLSVQYLLKLAAFLLTPLMAYFCIRLISVREMFTFLSIALVIVALCSLVFVYGLPEIGVSKFSRGYGWSGIYAHKSSLGRIMLLLVLMACLAKQSGLVRLLGIVIGFYVLANTNSRTSLYILVAIMIFFSVIFIYSYSRFARMLVVSLCLCILLWVVMAPHEILRVDLAESMVSVFSHGIDLTGRLQIWAVLLELISENIWFGIGFDGVWQYNNMYGFESALGWRLTDAHNGYLEVVLQLGLLGLALFSVIMIYYVLSIRYLYKVNDRFRNVFLAIFIFVLLVNLVSSHFLEVFSPVNFFIYITIFYRHQLRAES